MISTAHIRTLLRCLRRPHDLERNALALRLKHALGAPSARAAFAQLCEQAFAHAGDAYRLHHELLRRFDIDRRVPRSRAAAELGVSARRFFYLHAEAIEVVERYANEILKRTDEDGPASSLVDLLLDCDPARTAGILQAGGAAESPEASLKQLHAAVLASSVDCAPPRIPQNLWGPDAAVAAALHCVWLELHGRREEAVARAIDAEKMRFDYFGQPDRDAGAALVTARMTMARHDGDAQALARYAKDDRWSKLPAIEAALANGDLERAKHLTDLAGADTGTRHFRFTATLCLRRTQIQLLSGELRPAAENARLLALMANPHRDIADTASLVYARACIALGWPLAWRDRPPHGIWYELYDRALLARSLGDEQLACNTLVRATCHGYLGVSAHAAATMALLNNDMDQARDAWLIWLQRRHFEQGFDMMPQPVGRAFLVTEAARRCIHDLAQAECTQWPILSFLTTSELSDAFWKRLLDVALHDARAEAMTGILAALLAATNMIEGTLANRNGPSPRNLARLISVLLPFEERERFIKSFTSIVNYSNARARRRRDQLRGRLALKLSG